MGLHCRDIINSDDKTKSSSKRFCVPIGYHGGYGWPFWHGYPGAGLGMFGWGWPWYKSKVPKGEKGKDQPEKPKVADKADDDKKSAEKEKTKDLKSTQRDQIPGK